MEKLVFASLSVLTVYCVGRILLRPLGWAAKALLRGICGLSCLMLLNSASSLTGLTLSINAVTVLAAGSLGLPGLGIIALLEMIREGP